MRAGQQALGGPQRQPLDLVGAQVPAAALVGDRGVEVAVGDDDGAALERGPDQRGDVVRAVGRVEQRLGARVDVVAVQHRLAQHQPELGAARLAREHDLAAEARQPVAEQAGLGRLAGAVAALEGDEQPGGTGVRRGRGARSRASG